MQKILWLTPSAPPFASLPGLSRQLPPGSELVAVFLKELDFDERIRMGQTYGRDYAEVVISRDLLPHVKNEALRARMSRIMDSCEAMGLRCSVHLDKGDPLDEVLFESRYADLIMTGASLTFGDKEAAAPSRFVRELMARAECPVLLAPDEPSDFQEIVLAYDGTASSVFAMKQFSYLFPNLRDKHVTVMEVRAKEGGITEQDRISEWLRCHFENVHFETAVGSAPEALQQYISGQQGRLLVMGAWGRNMLSNFLKPSTASQIIGSVQIPVFIAHH